VARILFHFQIKNLFVGFALPYNPYCLRLAFAIFLIWKWNIQEPGSALL
jgi:hypothetical protein